MDGRKQGFTTGAKGGFGQLRCVSFQLHWRLAPRDPALAEEVAKMLSKEHRGAAAELLSLGCRRCL